MRRRDRDCKHIILEQHSELMKNQQVRAGRTNVALVDSPNHLRSDCQRAACFMMANAERWPSVLGRTVAVHVDRSFDVVGVEGKSEPNGLRGRNRERNHKFIAPQGIRARSFTLRASDTPDSAPARIERVPRSLCGEQQNSWGGEPDRQLERSPLYFPIRASYRAAEFCTLQLRLSLFSSPPWLIVETRKTVREQSAKRWTPGIPGTTLT